MFKSTRLKNLDWGSIDEKMKNNVLTINVQIPKLDVYLAFLDGTVYAKMND